MLPPAAAKQTFLYAASKMHTNMQHCMPVIFTRVLVRSASWISALVR